MLGAVLVDRGRLRHGNCGACDIGVDRVAELHEEVELALVGVEDRVVDADIAAPVARDAEAEAFGRAARSDRGCAREEGGHALERAVCDAHEVAAVRLEAGEVDLAGDERVRHLQRLREVDVAERVVARDIDGEVARARSWAGEDDGVSADRVADAKPWKRLGRLRGCG